MTVRLNPSLSRLRASPTLAINERIRELNAQGEDIVHFGFGQSPFPVAPRMVEEMKRWAGEKDYMPAAGLKELREAVARYYGPILKKEIDPDLVLVGPGSKTLLFHALFCHSGPLIIPAGSWVSYGPQAILLNKPCHVLDPTPERQFKFSPEALDEHLTNLGSGHQCMVLLNSPNNPTGATYDEDELKALAEVLRRHDAVVLADEIYGQVTFDGEYRSISHHLPERTLVTTGLSKAFSAGGYRLGIMILPEEHRNLRGPMVNLSTETFSSVTCAVQRAAVLAYSHDEEVEAHVADCTSIHRLVNGYVARELEAGGVVPGTPQGAFYLFPGFEAFRGKAGIETSDRLAEVLLEDHKVATLPGTAFFAPPEVLNVRISPVDYDGGEALRVFRDMAAAGEVDGEEFVKAGAPRIPEGVRRLLALGG